ncbi:hypothetical protein RFA46_003216 [Vibrio vulnificus]|nr:hypothetical protein [Vibrio vulnificus]ELP5729295.1 hypothetical protein [Vibrio vulnificus]MCU8385905.1 hypothetical protein [Vibrio vulnificus]
MVTGKGKTPFSDAIEAAESEVKKHCEFLGYGRVMQIASEGWLEKDQLGAHVIGVCAGLTEPCGCNEPSKCDWCCGSRWLTKKVKAVKTQLEG